MHLVCFCGLRGLMRLVLLLTAVLLPGTAMRAQTTTTTTLAVSPSTSPLAPQTVVTLTATVTAGGTAVHPGLVTFCVATAPPCVGLAVLGTAQLTSAGTAALRFFPGIGSQSYIAIFAGTTAYATSTSSAQAVTVSPPATFPTTTAITSSGSVGAYTLTATVVGTGNATLGPTGSVSFIDTTNSNSVGTVTLGSPTLGHRFANATGSPIGVGELPVGVAVGDFNGDGHADLAVSNSDSTISILLGNGSGGFAPAPGSPVTVGAVPYGVAVGDFNGDGHADLAVVNTDSGTVTILLGNGSGGFSSAPGSPVAVGTNPYLVAVGDFNGDGNADLAVTNFTSNNVSILLGDGSGGFTQPSGSPIAVGGGAYGVAVGYFNGDGHADLAVTSQRDGNVSILLGDGGGGFTQAPGSPVAVGTFPVAVAVGDFNGDGHADLAVANVEADSVSILLGNGSGGFTQPSGSPVAVGSWPNDVVVGDFNGDGIPDLAVPNFESNNVSILLGDRSGGFAPAPGSPVAVGTWPYAVAVGDFNGDGIADLAVPNFDSNDVSILLNQVTQTATAVLPGVSIPGSGIRNVEATYPGDTHFADSTSPTIPLTGSRVATATTLALSTSDTIAFGTQVILTAAVTPYTAGSLTATGTMSFYDGTTLLGTVPTLSTGEASLTVPSGGIPGFAVGTHTLTALYEGDAHFLSSTSGPVSLTVSPVSPAVSLVSSNNPSSYGQPVTFTATVPSGATGTIQFRDGTANLGGPVTLAAGVAAYTSSSLTPGARAITAVYSGDGSHLPMTSDVLTQQVTSLPTATLLAVSPSSPLAAQTVMTLTATVTASGAAVHPGLVTFCEATEPPCVGLAVVGTAQLTSAGTAALRFIPRVGSHNYIAIFAGTTAYTASISSAQAVTVSPPATLPTTTAITSSGSAGNYTLRATVVGTGNATLGPTGSVSFIDTTNSNSVLGTATLGTPTLGHGFVNATGSPIAVGNLPVAAAVGDFNGDGIADLVVANDTDNSLSILLGNGHGGFSPAPGSPIAVGPNPFGVVVGDFNSDGVADLAVVNSGSTNVSILLGDGHGGFSPAVGSPVAVGTDPFGVAVGDFNGDGIADLAVANWGSNNVTILLGNGSGGFSASGSPVAVGTRPYAITVGDFNGDGIADLAVANQTSTNVSILLGNGSGGFSSAPGSPVTVGNNPQSLVVGDFNGDGIADLAVTNYLSNDMNILLGDGHGGFSSAPGSPVATGAGPNYVAVEDFNGDGIADLVVANLDADDVSIFLGNGSGGFALASGSTVAVGHLPYAVAVGDFDGDGIADLAVPNFGANDISILLNQVTQTATAVLTAVSIPGSGTRNVEAAYPGDANFGGSTSPTIPLTASPVTTATRLVLSTADTIAIGTPVILTADVVPYTAGSLTATGTMTFHDGATLLGTALISSTGEASITVSTFAVGTHTLTAVYAGDTNFTTSTSSSVSLTVSPTPIAVSLVSSDNPSGFGQAVTFTATVPSGATGTIQFKDGGANVGAPVTLAGGVATFTTSALMQGTHSITAAYSGDGSHAASTSDVLLQLVTPAILTVTANNSTRMFGQPNATLTYTITGFIGSDTQASSVTGAPTLLTTATEASPVGSYPIVIGQGTLAATNYSFVFVNGTLTVTPATLTVNANNASRVYGQPNPPFTTTITGFLNGDTAAVVSGAAAVSTTATAASPVGTYPITATQGTLLAKNYSFAFVNGILTVTKAKLTVTANHASRVLGLPNPPFTTTITGFVNGDTSAVVSGAAAVSTTATTASPVGTYPIIVTQGTLSATNYGFAFVNGILTVDVVIVTPPTGPAVGGSPVTLTATVPFGATGTVTFDDGTTVLGTVTIPTPTVRTDGITVTLVTTLAPGTHIITAVYSGDANFAPATSPPVTLVVTAPPPDFTVASSTGRQLIPPGASANFTIVVSSMNGPFTNSVTMSASNLPPGATYTFNPATVTPGASGGNTTFTVSVPPQSHMASRSRRLGPIAFAVLLLPFACLKRYRRRPQRLLVWMLAALVSLGTVSGCGEGGYFSQTEQTYTITVTATSGTLVRSTTVTLTVE
ncbi:MAG TPA: Ig-like domain repeat protein [Edaphobacter sp.]